MEWELDLSDRQAFEAAAEALKRHKSESRPLRGPNFAVALAIFVHRSVPRGAPAFTPPDARIYSPPFGAKIGTGALEELCDLTWTKSDEFVPDGATGNVFHPFTSNFSSVAANSWRNSFDLQSGLGCDAPFDADNLQSPAFRDAVRFDCPHRSEATGQCQSPSGRRSDNKTCFYPSKGGDPPTRETGAAETPKLLSRAEDGYWFLEPTEASLTYLVGDANKRVPAYAFVAALYLGSEYFARMEPTASLSRLQSDLALDDLRFAALFDADPNSSANAEFLEAIGAASSVDRMMSPSVTGSSQTLSEPVEFSPRAPGEISEVAARKSDPSQRRELLEKAVKGHQLTLNALVEVLERNGHSEFSEQLDGYDLASVGGSGVPCLFEVKTWTQSNLSSQIRKAVVQLWEYRFRNADALRDASLFLVLSSQPPLDYWAWRFLIDECDVLPIWISDHQLWTVDVSTEEIAPAVLE